MAVSVVVFRLEVMVIVIVHSDGGVLVVVGRGRESLRVWVVEVGSVVGDAVTWEGAVATEVHDAVRGDEQGDEEEEAVRIEVSFGLWE